MLLLAISSGLAGYVADARDFLVALRFARPELLWLFLLFPVFAILDRWASRHRRLAIAKIGRSGIIASQLTQQPSRQRGLRFAQSLAWTLLVLGVAGPLWGKSDETGIAVGRDVVIAIDLSQSMIADDMADKNAPKRWEAARNAALDIIDGMARRGGHRIAVILFAARPKVICKLTTDYDHARAIVSEINGEWPPVEIRPAIGVDIPSGTRIGAGLIAAVKAHDNRFPGYQDIILISDGDDPGEDREWVRGADAARDARIPVYTVGVGDPDNSTFREIDMELFETRLHEAPLKQIAAETRGQYLASRKESPRLAEFFRTGLEPLPSREVSDESITLPKQRYLWCLLPSLVLFSLVWLRGNS